MTRKLLQERTLCSPNDKQPLIIVLWAQIYFKSSADFFFFFFQGRGVQSEVRRWSN